MVTSHPAATGRQGSQARKMIATKLTTQSTAAVQRIILWTWVGLNIRHRRLTTANFGSPRLSTAGMVYTLNHRTALVFSASVRVFQCVPAAVFTIQWMANAAVSQRSIYG